MLTSFKEHLVRQFGFLERSCVSYDQGFFDESIRMATVIRVLIHDTNSSTSLLKHLNATDIQLTSTVLEVSEQTIMYHGMGVITFNSKGSTWKPMLDDFPVIRSVPVRRWWSEVVFVEGAIRLTRRLLVLGAANKDGGAHVDDKLSPEYAALARIGSIGSINDVTVMRPIENVHLGFLRQVAHEVLISPELHKLAE